MFGHPGILLSVASLLRNDSVVGIASIKRQEIGRKS
jgi:hypothetical protein